MSRMTDGNHDHGGPRRRSDGEQTHAQILDAAMRLASIEGLGTQVHQPWR
ncbi:hypothetical protein ACNSTU_08220 [Aquisalimonas sp. APHAB1-3]